MNIKVFASGSGGNCMLLSDRGTHLLIDAGISARRIIQSLRTADLDIQDIGGVLITHEHSDHVSGLKTLLHNFDVPLYAPHTVAARLCGMLPEAEDHMRVIPTGECFRVGSVSVRAFHTPHDTDESVGYRVEGSGVFALATDMGHVTDEVLNGLTGADTVLVESNHDLDMLYNGPYPVYLKRRILSDQRPPLQRRLRCAGAQSRRERDGDGGPRSSQPGEQPTGAGPGRNGAGACGAWAAALLRAGLGLSEP